MRILDDHGRFGVSSNNVEDLDGMLSRSAFAMQKLKELNGSQCSFLEVDSRHDGLTAHTNQTFTDQLSTVSKLHIPLLPDLQC